MFTDASGFTDKVAEYSDDILAQATQTYLGWAGQLDSDWFTYRFPDGSGSADVEIWTWDDGFVYVSAYRMYEDDEGYEATHYDHHVSLGYIDYVGDDVENAVPTYKGGE